MKFKIMEVHEKAQSENCIPSNYSVKLTNTLNEILKKKKTRKHCFEVGIHVHT